jgi:hypothetical protein
VLSGMSSSSSSRNMSSSIFARRCRNHHAYRSTSTYSSTARRVHRRPSRVSQWALLNVDRLGKSWASVSFTGCCQVAGRAFPIRHRTSEETDRSCETGNHTRLALPATLYTRLFPSHSRTSLPKTPFATTICPHPPRSLPPYTTSQGPSLSHKTRLASSFRVPHTKASTQPF